MTATIGPSDCTPRYRILRAAGGGEYACCEIGPGTASLALLQRFPRYRESAGPPIHRQRGFPATTTGIGPNAIELMRRDAIAAAVSRGVPVAIAISLMEA
jgi:hypothetical protein